jgi:hypothetical protein
VPDLQTSVPLPWHAPSFAVVPYVPSSTHAAPFRSQRSSVVPSQLLSRPSHSSSVGEITDSEAMSTVVG